MGCTHNVKKKASEEISVTDSFTCNLLQPIVFIEALRQSPNQDITFQIAAPALWDSLIAKDGPHNVPADSPAGIAVAILVAGHEDRFFQGSRLEYAVNGQSQSLIGFFPETYFLHRPDGITVRNRFINGSQEQFQKTRPLRLTLQNMEGPAESRTDILAHCQRSDDGAYRCRRQKCFGIAVCQTGSLRADKKGLLRIAFIKSPIGAARMTVLLPLL